MAGPSGPCQIPIHSAPSIRTAGIEVDTKWLFVIVLLSPTEETDFEPTAYATKAACGAAAKAFVEAYPTFAWRDPEDEDRVEHPILRSYVECVPVEEDKSEIR